MGLVAVVALLTPAHAFTGHVAQHSMTNVNSSLLRRSSSCKKSSCNRQQHPQHHSQLHILHAEEPSPTSSDVESSTEPSKYDDGDPRKALEQFGSLFSQVSAIFTEGSSWDEATLERKTEEFVRTYLRVFVPGIGYAATSFAVFGSSVATIALALSISGRGYADVLGAVGDVDFLRNLLEKADPAWGNVAIALLGCEVLSPVILGVTLALTPKTMDALQGKLDEWGWGEDDIDKRTAEILNLTT